MNFVAPLPYDKIRYICIIFVVTLFYEVHGNIGELSYFVGDQKAQQFWDSNLTYSLFIILQN